MAEMQDLIVKITCECDTKGFDEAIKKMKEFNKASKLSLWTIIKLRIMKIFIKKPKIKITELIERNR